MASVAGGRGAQTINYMYFKPILRKGYHRKSGSPEMVSERVKVKEEEVVAAAVAGATTSATGANTADNKWWVRDDRTGVYYPKGQEKVIQDIPDGAAKDFGTINWFR